METSQASSEITFDDFLKVDIRVGTIISAEKVEKSKKLLKLQVDFGEFGQRQILAGIAETFAVPEFLHGRQTLFVVNLAPRKMMGLESHGMILAVPSENNTVQLPGNFSTRVVDGVQVG